MDFGGQHCFVCHLLDFLPFVCNSCGLTYCLEHRLPSAHSCEKCDITSSSPSSSSPPPSSSSSSSTSDDSPPSSSSSSSSSSPSSPSSKKRRARARCIVIGCSALSTELIRCNECHAVVCFSHRHGSDHSCVLFLQASEELAKEKQKADHDKAAIIAAKKRIQERVQASVRKSKSAKNVEMARKVAIMKLRMKATGPKGISDPKRLYYNVHFPKEKPQDLPLFGSTEWTIGQALDRFCQQGNLVHHNKDPRKPLLCVFFSDSEGELIQAPFRESLQTLPSGSDLWLEFIPRTKT